jgi:hypothetical protein
MQRILVTAAMALFATSAAHAQAKLVLFTGTVVDSTRKPLENAEVSIGGMNLVKTTNDKGVFRIDNVPAGVHHVTVRKIGYAQLDTSLAFPEDQEIEWRVTMRERVVTLDSVIVSASVDPLIKEFEENRKRGFGRFMTRADLSKQDGVTLPNVLRSLSGANIVQTNTNTRFITSKRAPITGCPIPRMSESREGLRAEQARTDECLRRERIFYVPEAGEEIQGIKRACYAQVYVDRQLMNSGRPTPPFDINSFATEQVEAVEWYESESQTPSKYSVNNARCGVLVIHVRKKK